MPPRPGRCTVARVDSKDLITREQAATVLAVVGPQLAYLGRLRTRLERIGCTPSDPLYRSVCLAYDRVHAVSVHLHYLTCPPGTTG